MIRLYRKLIRDQQGSTIVLVGFSLILLLTVTGLVVDGGTMYAAKSHMQKAANAAALSGAQELTSEPSKVEAVVDEILKQHQEQASLTGTQIVMKSTVRVHLRKQVPLSFSRLLGKETVTVEVEAAAQILPMGSAMGAAPLGVDDSINLVYNSVYRLRVDSDNVDTGFFGILALGGSGADPYEYNLKYGYDNQISVGDVIPTQTGNVTGKTREGVKLRIDSDPYPPGEYDHRDSTRILLIPLYKPCTPTICPNVQSGGNQMKNILVTGFAYFYILEPMSNTDTELKGMFIQRADTGFSKPGVADTGAYAIKLIE